MTTTIRRIILIGSIFMVACVTLFVAVHREEGPVDPMPLFLLDQSTPNNPYNSSIHGIPNILIFTYATNLLQATNKSQLSDEEQTLQWNVQNTIRQHPGATVRFLTDTDCMQSIRRVMGEEMVEYFRQEKHGYYKGDVCRGAALYETGGLYMDVDLGVRMSVWTALGRPKTPQSLRSQSDAGTVPVQLVIPQEPALYQYRRRKRQLFQAFIGVRKGHDVIWRYLKEWESYYRGTMSELPVRDYGVAFMKRALDAHMIANPDSKVDGSIVLWTESKHSTKLYPHVPTPTWKVFLQEACTFVVIAQEEEPTTSYDKNVLVPFYSHVRGSRRCNKH